MNDAHCKIGKVTPKLSVVQEMAYPINRYAVSQAQRLLDNCLSGEYRTIGVVAINSRGYVHTGYAIWGKENPVLVQGAVMWLSDRIAEEVRKSK